MVFVRFWPPRAPFFSNLIQFFVPTKKGTKDFIWEEISGICMAHETFQRVSLRWSHPVSTASSAPGGRQSDTVVHICADADSEKCCYLLGLAQPVWDPRTQAPISWLLWTASVLSRISSSLLLLLEYVFPFLGMSTFLGCPRMYFLGKERE